jgi:hypothetical protein
MSASLPDNFLDNLNQGRLSCSPSTFFFFLTWAFHLTSSQGELVKEGVGDNSLGRLFIGGTDQVHHSFRAKALGVDHLKHATVLGLLPVRVVDKEDCRFGAQLGLCEVAQIHEGALREQGKIRVAKPHVKAAGYLVKEAGELVQSLGTTEAGAGIEHEFTSRFLL